MNATPPGHLSWKEYWQSQGQSWRLEPEIGEERQQFLAERLRIHPDIENRKYPFSGEQGGIKLDRADVEWLLVTHESGEITGPIDWRDETQRQRKGLDLRGADLRKTNLSGLPLARMRGGLGSEDTPFSQNDLEPAATHLEGADLANADLQGASMWNVHLESATLIDANLEGAELHCARCQNANLENANLENTDITEADLRGVSLARADLRKASLQYTMLIGVDFQSAHLEGANVGNANLAWASVEDDELTQVFSYVTFSSGFLGSRRFHTELPPADLREAHFDADTHLNEAKLGDSVHGTVLLADAHYGDENLAVVDWAEISILGDEIVAREQDTKFRNEQVALFSFGAVNSNVMTGYADALRANRQLAAALRNQGLQDDSDRFAYHARVLQRQFLFRRAL